MLIDRFGFFFFGFLFFRFEREYLRYVLTCIPCLSLSYSFLPVQIGVEIPAEVSGWIVESELLVNFTQFVQILLIQSEIAGQIALDPLRRLALRQHAVSVCDAPRQRHLRAVLAVFLADFDDGGVFD